MEYSSARVRGITPYVAGEQPKGGRVIKLNTNENAYGPSPKALAAIASALEGLERYPDPNADALREAVARHHGLEAANVFMGNGSDEVLALAYLAFFDPGQAVATPHVGYSFYPVYAQLFDVRLMHTPMRDRLHVDVDALIAEDAPVLLANPNAPTSVALGLEDIRRIADALLAKKQLFLVDEAYVDFGAQSAIELIGSHPNVLVVRTFSKSHALAGLRAGYALGQPHLIETLHRIKDSFNSYPMDRLAQAGAAAAIQDEGYFSETRLRIMDTRDAFLKDLRQFGFEGPDSCANFVYVRHPDHAGADLHAALRKRGILVRHFAALHLTDYLRITIGTPADMACTLNALKEITQKAT